MDKLYTIGEVSEITGIEKRTLKYYVERKIIFPSHKKSEGGKEYWLYTEDDIFRIRQITLYRELGYSADDIRKMLSSPDFDWRNVLDEQIEELKRRKRHLENLIFAAEMMRYANELEEDPSTFDISDFDNDIDKFAVNTFSYDEEELASQSIEKVSKDLSEVNIAEAYREGQKVMDMLASVKRSMEFPPESKEMQESLSVWFAYFQSVSPKADVSLHDVLFGFRLISNLSLDRISDMLFAQEGSLDYLSIALQKYCDDHKRRD